MLRGASSLAGPVVAILVACGAGTPSSAAGPEVSKRTVEERMPDGSLRKTTVTVTRKVVDAPAPPDRPADPYPADGRVRYNVEQLNAYRARAGVGPLRYDAAVGAFATEGSTELAADHRAHAYFKAHVAGSRAFGPRSAENQGDPDGVPSMDPDAARNGRKQIDVMLKLMFDEGPGGGHHDNMLDPRYKRVGVGVVDRGGRLYLTNDFSD
jgi:hypothetical protein